MDIEWLILADGAQVVNGKLYLLGGGWESVTVNADFPVHQRCALAAAFRVPWIETNQPINIEIEIVQEDGREHEEPLLRIAGPIEVGRPAGFPGGGSQRAQLAVEMELTFSQPGTYAIVGCVEGQELKRVPFIVVANPMRTTRRTSQPTP